MAAVLNEDDDANRILKEIYTDPSNPGSYASANALYRQAKGRIKGLTMSKVVYFLKGQDGYTMHRRVVHRFRRRRYVVDAPGHVIQMDLADFRSLAKQNKGFNYVLVAVDVFSRYLYTYPLKNKTAGDTEIAIRYVFDNMITGRPPKYIHTDKGLEFRNSKVGALLKKHGAKFLTSENSDVKASIAERTIRTIKNKIFKYFSQNNTLDWSSILGDVTSAYNNSIHSTIKATPLSVHSDNDVAERVRQIMKTSRINRQPLGDAQDDTIAENDEANYAASPQYKFSLGETVRLSTEKFSFQRGYQSQWTREIFIVWRRIPTDPPTYTVKDHKGRVVQGNFYAQEMQSVREPETYKIERVVRRQVQNGIPMVLVKWLGYPDEDNSWIPADQVSDI